MHGLFWHEYQYSADSYTCGRRGIALSISTQCWISNENGVRCDIDKQKSCCSRYLRFRYFIYISKLSFSIYTKNTRMPGDGEQSTFDISKYRNFDTLTYQFFRYFDISIFSIRYSTLPALLLWVRGWTQTVLTFADRMVLHIL